MRLLRTQGRQNYLLGKLAPGESIESFVEFLLDKGFGNHFVAFDDEGQVASLRYTPDFKHQYHVRIFKDGEVRGHQASGRREWRIGAAAVLPSGP